MFRVLVDFDEDIPMVDESLEQFAQLLKTRTNEEGMAPLTADAVARLATYSARLAEPGACRRVSATCSNWSARRISFASWPVTK
jgi:predicted ATP-dependent protease